MASTEEYNAKRAEMEAEVQSLVGGGGGGGDGPSVGVDEPVPA
jgi:hypothetical protein